MEGDVFLPPLEPSTAAQPVFFRKGLVVAFTPSTGANQIRVGGTLVPNVPMLVSGSETALQVGQTVGIMVVGTAFFIVGRVVTPGSAAYGSTASAFATAGGSAFSFGVPAGFQTICSATLQVPSWASKAVVIALTRGAINNNWANSNNFQTQVVIPGGAFSAGNILSAPANAWMPMNYSNLDLVNVTPGGTITPRFDVASNPSPLPSHVDNGVTITAVGIFTTA